MEKHTHVGVHTHAGINARTCTHGLLTCARTHTANTPRCAHTRLTHMHIQPRDIHALTCAHMHTGHTHICTCPPITHMCTHTSHTESSGFYKRVGGGSYVCPSSAPALLRRTCRGQTCSSGKSLRTQSQHSASTRPGLHPPSSCPSPLPRSHITAPCPSQNATVGPLQHPPPPSLGVL